MVGARKIAVLLTKTFARFDSVSPRQISPVPGSGGGQYCAPLAPIPLERQFALSIAEDSWRLNRARAIENNMFALGHEGERHELRIALADARTFQANANQFQLLTIYEQRINRNLQRNLKQLHDLQAERREQSKRALEEAKLLAQLSLMKGLPYDTNQNGFVFSIAEINRAIDRDNRLQEARREAAEAARSTAESETAHMERAA